MKKHVLFFAVITALFLASCGSKTGTTEEQLPAPRNNGHFLMYYYPTHSIYSSDFGTELVKKDTCAEFLYNFTADENGKLYSAVGGTNVSVMVSEDGGENWEWIKNSDTTKYERAHFGIVAGKANTVYALSTKGDFYVTKDGGVNWTKKTSPCIKDTTHSSPAFSNSINLAVSADGKKLLAQAWYFEETVFSISYDEGSTWIMITPPTERNESKGVGFCGDRIVYASYDEFFYTDDLGKSWKNSEPVNSWQKIAKVISTDIVVL
jgi:photosystem II stability/assembly factor-like uncharacterized protein